jgi:hypothetical protein
MVKGAMESEASMEIKLTHVVAETSQGKMWETVDSSWPRPAVATLGKLQAAEFPVGTRIDALVFLALDETQRDGRACIYCHVEGDEPMVPAGLLEDVQVFAHLECIAFSAYRNPARPDFEILENHVEKIFALVCAARGLTKALPQSGSKGSRRLWAHALATLDELVELIEGELIGTKLGIELVLRNGIPKTPEEAAEIARILAMEFDENGQPK